MFFLFTVTSIRRFFSLQVLPLGGWGLTPSQRPRLTSAALCVEALAVEAGSREVQPKQLKTGKQTSGVFLFVLKSSPVFLII